MFKKITAILICLIIVLIPSDSKSAIANLENTSGYAYSSVLSPLPKNAGDIIDDEQEYLLKYRKRASSQSDSAIRASEVIDRERYRDVTNIAFLGLDESISKSYSRTDVIMIVSLDSKYEKVKVTSLMRDMYVKIPGKDDNRINSAYALGGAVLALKTINYDFGLDIKNYVTVDFSGLEKIIDKVGGVEINVKKNEIPYLNTGEERDKSSSCVTKEGIQVLNGKQAVAYARIRYTGNSDYERTERQRRVLNELFKKIKEQGILNLPVLAFAMLPYVKTNMSTKDIIVLGTRTLNFKTGSIEQYRLPVDGTYKSTNIKGMSVLVPDMDANRKKLFQFIYESK